MFVAKLSPVTAGTVFKSGKAAKKDTYILKVLAGECPRNRFIDPVIANSEGMEEGFMYLMNATPSENPEFPDSYDFTSFTQVNGLEITTYLKEYGPARFPVEESIKEHQKVTDTAFEAAK